MTGFPSVQSSPQHFAWNQKCQIIHGENDLAAKSLPKYSLNLSPFAEIHLYLDLTCEEIV